jgi:hypothetical protein
MTLTKWTAAVFAQLRKNRPQKKGRPTTDGTDCFSLPFVT